MLRRLTEASVLGKRRIGRKKTRWKESSNIDKESVEQKVGDVIYGTRWKREAKTSHLTPE